MNMNGIDLINAERLRQQAPIEEGGEGFDAPHDAGHWVRHLAAAAACYEAAEGPDLPLPETWPWGAGWWKPRSRRRNLERAGALYLAAAEAFARRKPAIASDPTGYGAQLRARADACAAAIDTLSAEG